MRILLSFVVAFAAITLLIAAVENGVQARRRRCERKRAQFPRCCCRVHQLTPDRPVIVTELFTHEVHRCFPKRERV